MKISLVARCSRSASPENELRPISALKPRGPMPVPTSHNSPWQLAHARLAAVDLDAAAHLPRRAMQVAERDRGAIAGRDRRGHLARVVLRRMLDHGAARDRRIALDHQAAQRARRVALRVDAEHRLLTDVAALLVIEKLHERRLEREVIV